MSSDRHTGSAEATTRVFDDPAEVARAAAGELVLRLIGIQASRRTASLVLTGGGVGTAMLAAVADDPDQERVDWSAVSLWWGDERFLPAGDGDRNETGARSALLDRLPGLDPANVHPMPASDGPAGADVGPAAAAYAAELAAAADPWTGSPGELAGVPHLDVVLLGVGPDGHVASLFPDRSDPAAGAVVIPVTDSPKPPPVRTSLTLAVLNSADEVWLLATGGEKADAVHSARTSPGRLPAARVHGTRLTRWWLDAAAAGEGRPSQG